MKVITKEMIMLTPTELEWLTKANNLLNGIYYEVSSDELAELIDTATTSIATIIDDYCETEE